MEKLRLLAVERDAQIWRSDTLAVEEPLELRLEGEDQKGAFAVSIAVTMRTPSDDFALAMGFLWGEGVLTSPDQVEGIRYCVDAGEQQWNVVTVRLRTGVSVDVERLRRNFYTTSSCGVCGKASLEAVASMVCWPKPLVEEAGWCIAREAICALPSALRQAQEIFLHTGGLHAAALFTSEGQIIRVREDVGRHNAVDKVVGASLLLGELPLSSYGLLVSGRASFELVQKARMAGVVMLVAVGAPSTLAVRLAREQGISLVGFVREDRFNVYAGHARIQPNLRADGHG